MNPLARAVALCVLLCLPAWSRAEIVEEVIEVPVSVKTIDGEAVDQDIVVTVFRDDRRRRAPYLVLHHGRPARQADFEQMGRQRYTGNSRYFVARGFVVLVPTRVGYGASEGPDVEYTGPCDKRNFAPAFAAVAEQTAAALRAARDLPYVDLSRGIVVGQSFGGMGALASAARGLPGLAGAVNFAGGAGGNPAARPENPCSAHRLAAQFKAYGARAKVPTLWLYSENDRYWGAALPQTWFDAYVGAGGTARFVPLPPYRDNGHGIFSGNPDAWKPAFEEFVRELGF